jgi:hypothetical protein
VDQGILQIPLLAVQDDNLVNLPLGIVAGLALPQEAQLIVGIPAGVADHSAEDVIVAGNPPTRPRFILDGEEGYLENPLVHYNYDTLAQFVERQNRYTDYEARILFDQDVRPKPHNFVLQPLREFRRRYVSLEGYKDGFHGLLLSLLMAYYTLVMYLRLRRLWQSQS